MKRFWIITLLLMIAFQNSKAQFGENKTYRLISADKYQTRIEKNKDVLLRRYVVIPAFDKNKNLIFSTKNQDSILIGAATLLTQLANLRRIKNFVTKHKLLIFSTVTKFNVF